MATAALQIGIIKEPRSMKIVQAIGITSTALLAGGSLASSFLTVPSLLSCPDPRQLARQFRVFTERQKVGYLPAVLGFAAAWGYVAFEQISYRSARFGLFVTSTAIPLLTIPYKYFCERPIGDEVLAREQRFSGSSSPGNNGNHNFVDLKDPAASSTSSDTEQAPIPTSAPSSEYEPTTFKKFCKTLISRESRPAIRDLSVHQLVDRWAWFNLGYALAMGMAATCAAFAMVDEDTGIFGIFERVYWKSYGLLISRAMAPAAKNKNSRGGQQKDGKNKKRNDAEDETEDTGKGAAKGKGKLKPANSINVRHVLCDKHSKHLVALEALNSGQSFDAVAKEHSEDKARQGGSLGWKSRGSLLAEFESVAYALEPSSTGKPSWGTCKTTEGYHIIMVEGRK